MTESKIYEIHQNVVLEAILSDFSGKPVCCPVQLPTL